MDEIVRQLGDNAYILSTSQRDGQIEIKATNEPMPTTARPASKARETFAQMLAARADAEEVTILQRNRSLGTRPILAAVPTAATAAAAPVRIEQPEHDPTPVATGGALSHAPAPAAERTDAPPVAQHLAGQQPGGTPNADPAMSAALARIEANLAKLVARGAPGMPAAQTPGAREARIVAAGFDRRVADLAEDGKDFAGTLAGRLVPERPEAAIDAQVILVMGPSGGGKTTLAAKFAALLAEHRPERRCDLIELRAAGGQGAETLRSHARILNAGFARWTVADIPAPASLRPGTTLVVDVPNDPELAEPLMERMASGTAAQIARILAIPGGSSAALISATLARPLFAGATVALTKLDECEITPPEISALLIGGAEVGWLSGTRDLIGNLSPATRAVMEEFLGQCIGHD
jgi:flagellar biosynthesis protein FlhF